MQEQSKFLRRAKYFSLQSRPVQECDARCCIAQTAQDLQLASSKQAHLNSIIYLFPISLHLLFLLGSVLMALKQHIHHSYLSSRTVHRGLEPLTQNY